MKIFITTQTYFPTANGQSVFATNLAEGMARAGDEVHVLTIDERPRSRHFEHNGVQVHRLSGLVLGFIDENFIIPLAIEAQIRALLDDIRPDIVHVLDPYPLSRSAYFQAAKAEIPVMGTHNFLPGNLIPYVPLLPNYKAGTAYLERMMWGKLLQVYNCLDRVITPTETARRIMIQNGLTTPVTVISNGIDLKTFYPAPNGDRHSLRHRFGLDPEKTLFLYVGRVDRDKGLDVLLHALRRLDRADIQLAIAGKGHDHKNLRQLAADLSLDGRIAFPGFIPSAELSGLLKSADVFVMPSQVELQSLATLEAMACGLPVLAADAGALPELVQVGQNGVLFQPGDACSACEALDWMADRSSSLSNMGKVSLEIASRHDLKRTIQAYQHLYQRQIGEAFTSQAPAFSFETHQTAI